MPEGKAITLRLHPKEKDVSGSERSSSRRATMKSLRRKVGQDNWKTIDDRFPYEETFSQLVFPRALDLNQLLQRSRKPLVLDIMSYGHVLTRLPIFGGLAVGLEDKRGPKLKEAQSSKNISFLEGNIMRRATWNLIENWLEVQNAYRKGFNMILSRPEGGLQGLGRELWVHAALLNRAWKLLSFNNGILLTQVSEFIFGRERLESWAKHLNKIPGINAVFVYDQEISTLLLVKGKKAPQVLPLRK